MHRSQSSAARRRSSTATSPPEEAVSTLQGLGRRPALLRLTALAVLIAGLFAAVALTGRLSAERVQDTLSGGGAVTPIAFIFLSSLLTVAMFPGPLLAAASGLLFGTALGTPVSIIAATTGASLAFLLSRRVGARPVQELSGRRMRAAQHFISQRGFLSVLYARILPAVPYNVVNYAAGLTRIPLVTFAAATAVGCAPRAFAYTALGGNLSQLDSPQAIVAYSVLLAMGLGGAVLAARDVRMRRALRTSASRSARFSEGEDPAR